MSEPTHITLTRLGAELPKLCRWCGKRKDEHEYMKDAKEFWCKPANGNSWWKE